MRNVLDAKLSAEPNLNIVLFVLGCKVFIWRPGNTKKDGEKAWFWKGPGTVIGSAHGSSKLWAALGSKVFKCAPEQLRRLKPEDEAAIKLVPELVDWNHQTSNERCWDLS